MHEIVGFLERGLGDGGECFFSSFFFFSFFSICAPRPWYGPARARETEVDGRLAFEESSGFAWAWLLCLLSPALGDGGARVEGPRLPPYPGQGHPGMHMDPQRMHMDPPRMPFPQGMAMPPGPGQIMWLTAVSAAPPLPTPILALSHPHMSLFACSSFSAGRGPWGVGVESLTA